MVANGGAAMLIESESRPLNFAVPEIWIDGIEHIESEGGGTIRIFLYANLPSMGGEPAREVKIAIRGSLCALPGVVRRLAAAVLMAPDDRMGTPQAGVQ